MRALLLVVIALAGCGPRSEPAVAGHAPDAGAPDATQPEVAAPPPMDANGCPMTFVAGVSANCVLAMPGQQTTCKYPEGTCNCIEPTQCGGAQMMHAPGSPGMLVCAPNDPAALKSDGCPWMIPTDKSPCKAERTCTYGACSYSQTIAACKGGKWSIAYIHSPPPP